VGVEEDSNREFQIDDYQLSVHPNPFTPNCTVEFVVHGWEFVDERPLVLNIHNVTGRLVRTFRLTNYQSPFNQITWDAGNSPAGIYFAKLVGNGSTETKKLVLMQ
jgi:hypothetical protein